MLPALPTGSARTSGAVPEVVDDLPRGRLLSLQAIRVD